jgi:hypothetical protein
MTLLRRGAGVVTAAKVTAAGPAAGPKLDHRGTRIEDGEDG